MKKRILSIVLCLVMVFSLLPFSALAADVDTAKYDAFLSNLKTHNIQCWSHCQGC